MTITVGTSDLPAAIANAKAGDIITAKPGTLVTPLPLLQAQNVSLYLDGVTLRMVLTPTVWPIDRGHVAAMAFLGFSGSYSALTNAQKTAVQSAVVPALVSTQTDTSIFQFLGTLAPIKDARLFDVKPPRQGQIAYNGLTLAFPVGWQSNVSKGILTVKVGVWGTYVHGGTFQNAQMYGSSYNAAGIRTQAQSDIFVEGATFQDCNDGILAGGSMVVDPNGDWYQDGPPDRLRFYGFNFDKDCIYDNCGSPATGLAHGRYGNDCLINLSVRPHSIRSNGGHFTKFHGGLQVCIDGNLEDMADSGGVEQCIDMDSGAAYVINNKISKNSAGNFGAPVLMRNGREPIPSWFENALVVKGNVITYLPNHVSWFVNSMNEPAFVKASGATNIWPGVPSSIRTVIDGNVFRAPAGSPVLRTPTGSPAGSIVQNNQILGLSDPVPDVRVPLPNYAWTRASKNADLADLLSHVDPQAMQTWGPKLLGLPTYPAGVSISFPEAQEDPAMIADLQAQIATLTKQLADETAQLAQQVQTLTADRDAQAAQAAALQAVVDKVRADVAA